MSWNPYPYAFGNPVNYTDPSGKFPWLVAGAIVGAIGGLAAYNAGRNFVKQVQHVVENRLPLECNDGNEIVDAFLDGLILGAGITLVVAMAGTGVAGLISGFAYHSPVGFIVAGAMAGALLKGFENLNNQVNKIIGEGRADNFIDALNQLDSSIFLDMVIGGVAGGFLGAGNGAAWTALGAYIVGFGMGNGLDSGIYISPKDISLVIIDGVILDRVDDAFNPKSPLQKFAFRFVSGAGAFALYSMLVDDDPLKSNEERGLFTLSGLANVALETLPEGVDDVASNLVDAVLNTFSFQWMK